MIDVYELRNPDLVREFKNKNHDELLEVASKSIFLLPVKDKNKIDKIAFQAVIDSNNNKYLPLFINMADIDAMKMINGKQVLVAHFGMIEQILQLHSKLAGICFNPGTMNCKLSKEDTMKICQLYHQNEDKLDFDPEFYKSKNLTMADLRNQAPMPRSEVTISIANFMKGTTIKKAYVGVKYVGGKLHYSIYVDYNNKEKSYIDELSFKLNDWLNDNETFEICWLKMKRYEKFVRYMKPIYEKTNKETESV